jgi:hypothetical protein
MEEHCSKMSEKGERCVDIAMPLLPSLAPLCVPMVKKLAETTEDVEKLQNVVRERRSSIFTYMFPYVRSEMMAVSHDVAAADLKEHRVTQQWLAKSIQMSDPKKRHVSYRTLNSWSTERGLLRLREWGRPEFQSAAALLIMRLSSSLKSGWLPSSIAPDEPAFWIWMQTDPSSPPVPVPLPLNEEGYQRFPVATLFWSEWPGAGWLDGWLSIGAFGAIRWAGRRDQRWTLSQQDILRWMPTLPYATFSHQFIADLERDQRHINATKVLYFLAHERLDPAEKKGNSHAKQRPEEGQPLLSGF